MIKVDFDDSWLKYHYRQTDEQMDGRTTLSLESLLRLKILSIILVEYLTNRVPFSLGCDWQAMKHQTILPNVIHVFFGKLYMCWMYFYSLFYILVYSLFYKLVYSLFYSLFYNLFYSLFYSLLSEICNFGLNLVGSLGTWGLLCPMIVHTG